MDTLMIVAYMVALIYSGTLLYAYFHKGKLYLNAYKNKRSLYSGLFIGVLSLLLLFMDLFVEN